MNKQAILEQKQLTDVVISAYKEFLRDSYTKDLSKRETVAEVLVGEHLVGNKHVSRVIRENLERYPGANKTGRAPETVSTPIISSGGGDPDISSAQSARIEEPKMAIGSAGEISDKDLSDWIEDCIPCKDRLKRLKDLNPGKDFLELLNLEAKARFGFLNDFKRFLESEDILGDICHLLSFMNELCLPDLKFILTLLVGLATKILTSLDINPLTILYSTVGFILAPFIGNLEALLKQYLELLLSPITCVLNALSFQLGKIPDIADAINSPFQVYSAFSGIDTSVQQRQNELELRNNLGGVGALPSSGTEFFNKLNNEINKQVLVDPNNPKITNVRFFVEQSLGALYFYLEYGRAFVVSKVQALEKAFKELLDTSGGAMLNGLSAGENLKRLARLINVIELMVTLTRFAGDNDDDAIKFCTGIKTENDTVRKFISQGLAGTTTAGFVRIREPDGTESIGLVPAELLGQIDETDLIGRPVGGIGNISRISQASAALALASGPKKIHKCFSGVPAEEMSKVQDWVTGLMNETT